LEYRKQLKRYRHHFVTSTVTSINENGQKGLGLDKERDGIHSSLHDKAESVVSWFGSALWGEDRLTLPSLECLRRSYEKCCEYHMVLTDNYNALCIVMVDIKKGLEEPWSSCFQAFVDSRRQVLLLEISILELRRYELQGEYEDLEGVSTLAAMDVVTGISDVNFNVHTHHKTSSGVSIDFFADSIAKSVLKYRQVKRVELCMPPVDQPISPSHSESHTHSDLQLEFLIESGSVV
jgi:hypothetical protein